MVTVGKVSCRLLISFLLACRVGLCQLRHRRMLVWPGKARLYSVTDDTKNLSGLQKQCLSRLCPIPFHSGIHADGSAFIWNSANCCGMGKRVHREATLALEVSSGKVIAQTVLSKFTRVRILTQGRAANIGESITAIPLEYPHPFMSVESLFHYQRP